MTYAMNNTTSTGAAASTTTAAPAPATAPAPAPAPTPPAPAPAPASKGKTTAKANVTQFRKKDDDPPAEVDKDLVLILTWPRGHDTPEERAFAAMLRTELRCLGHEVLMHKEEAFSVSIPHANGKASSTLFSCHIDTVDAKMSDPGVRKCLTYDANFGLIALDTGSPGTCLGADDGAGVWIMLKMIEAKVPGTYLFHRGEERGGISAKAIAKDEVDWLRGFDAAIAFDRHMHGDVIISQGGVPCASRKFGDALSKALNDAGGFSYMSSTHGVYTDTKEYRKVIPECVNISVGYHGQHGRNESVDYNHLHNLLQACLKLNWEALPIDRDPTATETTYTGHIGGYGGYGGSRFYNGRLWDDDDDGFGLPTAKDTKTKGTPTSTAKSAKPGTISRSERDALGKDLGAMSLEDLHWYCEEEPDIVMGILVDLIRENARLKADNQVLEGWLGLES